MSTIFFSSRKNYVVVNFLFLHRFYWPQNLYHPKLESMCLLKSATSMCLLHTYYAFLESRKSRRRKTKWLSALMLLEQRSLFLPISFCKKGELTVICQLVTNVTNVTMWANGRHIGDTDESPFLASTIHQGGPYCSKQDQPYYSQTKGMESHNLGLQKPQSEMSHLFISHNCHIRQWKICTRQRD